MHAADERSMLIEAAAAMLQEHAGGRRIDDPPWVSLLETRQQVLPCLWSKPSHRLREMMRLDRKYRELLVAAPITASMTGDLRWVTLLNGLPKGVHARHQTLVVLVGMRHRLQLLTASYALLEIRLLSK
jgi:hypothetical protein